jgi:CubicO group peptidase (beta-lactamase class C family)
MRSGFRKQRITYLCPMNDAFIEKMKDVIQTLPLETEISLSISSKNETDFIGLRKDGFGLSLIDNRNTAFEIGSVTKAITGNMLAKLVADFKIKLDDPIESFLPFQLLGKPPITFKQLALHTSGLPRMPKAYDDRADFMIDNPFLNFAEEDFINYFTEELLLESHPGEKAIYSNLGYALLAYLISKIENKPFSQIVKERIFHPLSMQHTSFNSKEVLTQFKTGLDKSGNPTSCWDAGIFNGSLGMISTAEDLSKFSKMVLKCEDEAIAIQVQNTFLAKPGVKTCLGWLMVNFDKEEAVIKINGGTAGSSASIFVNQKAQKAFTLCSNIHPDSYMELIEHVCIEAVTSSHSIIS